MSRCREGLASLIAELVEVRSAAGFHPCFGNWKGTGAALVSLVIWLYNSTSSYRRPV